jgi:hypothetical protein
MICGVSDIGALFDSPDGGAGVWGAYLRHGSGLTGAGATFAGAMMTGSLTNQTR